MCLAVPARIIACDGDRATVDLQGNRMEISRVLTPDTQPGNWVLVHAGFAITGIREEDALETWDYLRACYDGDEAELQEEAGGKPT